MRRLQVGVIGSCSDLNYSCEAEEFAKNIGKMIAESGYTLMFGAEKDINSLPTIAALAASKAGGETIGITYETGLDIFKPAAATVVIATGMVRGGGRETALMLSCDAVIAIAGGSGTLNEICVAYQANIPVVVVDLFGGWSKHLAGTFLDDRARYRFRVAKTPVEVMKMVNELKFNQEA